MDVDVEAPLILCDGVPTDTVADFAKQHRLRVDQIDPGQDKPLPGSTALVILLSQVSDDRLDEVLKPSIRSCFEASPLGNGLNEITLEKVKEAGAFLSLTTSTAYNTHVDQQLLKWIGRQIEIDDDLLSDMELALHEALANGLIHGNMGLETSLPDSFHGLVNYGDSIENKLNGKNFGQLRIELSSSWDEESIELTVQDNGKGFDDHAPIRESTTGRGLSLIHKISQSVSLTDNGRRITMRFDR